MQRADDTSEAIQVKRFYSGRPEHRKCRSDGDVEEDGCLQRSGQDRSQNVSSCLVAPTFSTAITEFNRTGQTFVTTSLPSSVSLTQRSTSAVQPTSCSFSAPVTASAHHFTKAPLMSKVEVSDETDSAASALIFPNGNATSAFLLPSAPPVNFGVNQDSAETVFYVDNDRQTDFDGLILPKTANSQTALTTENNAGSLAQLDVSSLSTPTSSRGTVERDVKVSARGDL